MPNYVLYRDDLETIDADEAETHRKIIELMTEGQNITRAKYGKAVRISHAKAHGLLQGELAVEDGLPAELAQGAFAKPGRYPVIVRMATAPGEFTDDSKVSTARGLAIKIFGLEGDRIAPFAGIATQDFVLDTGKEFFTSGAKTFLQAFKPNAELAPKLSDNIKGAVSTVARATNAVLNAVGADSGKLDFYGHPNVHPLSESYFSQTPYRYGDYVAKLAAVPSQAVLAAVQRAGFEATTPDALREAMVAYFRSYPAEFDVQVQLNTDLEKMSIEDAKAPWPEEDSQYRTVAKLLLPVQDAFDPARANYVDGDLSFSPAHALEAHRPLGGINRARLAAYTALSTLRRQENNRPVEEPADANAMPA